MISIPNDGEYYLGKDRVNKEQLADKVDKMLQTSRKKKTNRLHQERCGRELRRCGQCHQRGKNPGCGQDRIGRRQEKGRSGSAR